MKQWLSPYFVSLMTCFIHSYCFSGILDSLQLKLPEIKISIDEEIIKPLPTSSTTSVQKERKEQAFPFQTLRNDSRNLVKPFSIEVEEEDEIKQEEQKIELLKIPEPISYKPAFEITRQIWNEIRNKVEKIECFRKREKIVKVEEYEVEEVDRWYHMEKEAEDDEELKKLRERIALEEQRRFEEEQKQIQQELKKLLEEKKKEELEYVIEETEPEIVVDGFKPEVGTYTPPPQLEKKEEIQAKKDTVQQVPQVKQQNQKKKLSIIEKLVKKLWRKNTIRNTKQEKQHNQKDNKGNHNSPMVKKVKQRGLLYKLLDRLGINTIENKNLEHEEELFNIEPGKGFTKDFGMGSSLNITGSKEIKIKYGHAAYLDKARRRRDEAPPVSSRGFGIDQSLRVRLRGVVKDRIHINLDYNDINGQNQRRVNIDYKGEETAAIQEVNFGDVNLSDISSPYAKFVSCNKQLFGIRMKGKYRKQYDVAMVISRTKGRTEEQTLTKKDRKATELAHTSYIKRKYYDLLPEEEEGRKDITIHGVYLDDCNYNNVERDIHATATVTIGTNTVFFTHTVFERLENMKDYTLDENGVLIINRTIGEGYCLAVVFTYKTGTKTIVYPEGYSGDPENPGYVWMIKPRKDMPGWQDYDIFECKNRYNISRLQAGSDIEVEIVDKKGNSFFYTEKGEKISYTRLFGLDNNSDNKIDNVYIDYNRNLLIFPDNTPFNLIDKNSEEMNKFLKEKLDNLGGKEALEKYSAQEMYKPIPDRTIISIEPTYKIKLKYKTSGKQAYILKGWNIVEDSEEIYVNGIKQRRGIDYIIDYESGFLTFLNKPPEDAKIKAKYEYSSFGGAYQKNLVGARFQYKPNNNFHFGSTFIYRGAPTTLEIPRVGAAPENLRVFGVDASINLTTIAQRMFKLNKRLPFSMSIEGELATSHSNINTFGYAMIDAMEGCKEIRRISTHEDNWQIGSLPDKDGANNKRIKLLPHPDADKEKGPFTGPFSTREEIRYRDKEIEDKQEEEVLHIKYDPEDRDDWWVSIVSAISRAGTHQDMRDYTDLEFWIKPSLEEIINNRGIEIYIDFGVVSEDADGTLTDTPATEDKPEPPDNKGNGLLDKGEDIGWKFYYPDGSTTVMVGANNRQLDTEDLDGDGQISTQNHYYTIRINSSTMKNITDITQGMDLNEYRRYSVSLTQHAEIGDGEPDWSLIKHIRIRVHGTSTESGEINFGEISLVKNRWHIGSVTLTTDDDNATFTVSSLNALDDYEKYTNKSLKNVAGFEELHPDKDMEHEETMVIKYAFPASNSETDNKDSPAGFVYRKFRKQDYTHYKALCFWIRNVSYEGDGTPTMFIKFGIDEDNYIEYAFWLPEEKDTGWEKITIDLGKLKIKMVDIGTATYSTQTTRYFTNNPQVTTIRGRPELTNIQWLAIGIRNETQMPIKNGELWVNDIHLAEPEIVKGDAMRISVKAGYPKWINITWNNENVSGDFQGIGRPPTHNDTKFRSIDVRFNRIRFLPISYHREEKLEYTNPAKIDDILRSDFGTKTTISQNITVNLENLGRLKFGTNTIGKWLKRHISPLNIRMRYEDKEIDSNRRNDKSYKNSYTFSGQVKYKYEFPDKVLWFIPTGDTLTFTPTYKYTRTYKKEMYMEESVRDQIEDKITDDVRCDIHFIPLCKKTKDGRKGEVILSGKGELNFIQTKKRLVKTAKIKYTENNKYQLETRKIGLKIKNVKYRGIPGVSSQLTTEFHFNENNFRRDEKTGKDVRNLVTSSRFVVTGKLNPKEWKRNKNKAQSLPWWYRLLDIVTFTPRFEVRVSANYNNVPQEISLFDAMNKVYKNYYKGRLFLKADRYEDINSLFGSDTTRPSASYSRKFNLNSEWLLWKPLKSSLGWTFYEEEKYKGAGRPALKENITCQINLKLDMLKALPKYTKYFGSSTTVETNIRRFYEENKSQIPTKITRSIKLDTKLYWKGIIKDKINTTYTFSWTNEIKHNPNNRKNFYRKISNAWVFKYKYKKAKPIGILGKKLTLSRKLDTTCNINLDYVYNIQNDKETKDYVELTCTIGNKYELQKNTTSEMHFKFGYNHDNLQEKKNFYKYELSGNIRFVF